MAPEPASDLDLAALGAWMRTHVPGADGPLSAERFEGGQSNPTYKVTAGDRAFVLRRKPVGTVLASAHAVDREFKVLRALDGTGVPVARAHALCEDPAVLGSAFYVMDFVAGRVLWDPRLPGLS